jgi:protein-L-isoaspartate(D-aspartate) O-methyltransferase
MKDCRVWSISRVALSLALALPVAAQAAEDVLARARERMVSEQIERRGVSRPDVLRALRSTPRHLFVPTGVRPASYEDRPAPIGYGATISQPYIVALMTELLAPAKTHRVLEIGTGSGYQAAILGQLAGEVYSIEIVPELAKSAARTLRNLGYANVTVREGDGYKGWPEKAPFDGIIVTAAPPEVPEALIGQLARGGRLVLPVGRMWNQELMLAEKKAYGAVTRRSVIPVSFVPMRPGK